jgi:hypothetical protein
MRQIENPERFVKGAMSSHAEVRSQGRVPGQEARLARWDCSTPERTPKALRGTSEMELTRLSARDDERPRIVFPDGRPGWGLSPKEERENRAMEAAARERNRQHAENCQARHAANLKRWNSPKPLNDGPSRVGRIYHMDYI